MEDSKGNERIGKYNWRKVNANYIPNSVKRSTSPSIGSTKRKTSGGSSSLEVWPPPRHVHTAVTHQDKMYIFGGYGEGNHLGDLYSYSFGDGKWTEIKTKGGPSPRHSLSCVSYNNSLYFFGGICDKGQIMDDLYEFNLETITWYKVKEIGQAPSKRWGHSAVNYGNSMYIVGGLGEQYLNDCYEFNYGSRSWNKIPTRGINIQSTVPRPRHYHTAVLHDTSMYIWGGYGTANLDDLFRFDFVYQTWESIESQGESPSRRRGQSAVSYGDNMYIFGGRGRSNLNDLFKFNFSTKNWTQHVAVGKVAPATRHFHSCVTHGSSMYLFGGISGKSLADFDEIPFDSVTIEDIPLTSTPIKISGSVGSLSDISNSSPSSPDNSILENTIPKLKRKIRMKCHFEEEIRIISINENITYDMLMERLKSEYLLLNPFVIEYQDTEGDTITIRSQSDLEEAFFEFEEQNKQQKLHSMKIFLKLKQQIVNKSPMTSSLEQIPVPPSEEIQTISGTKWQAGPILGKGAFGSVYLGLNQETGEIFAVKRVELTGNNAEEAQEVLSLMKEIDLLKNLNHPNIVRYLGTEKVENYLHIFLEFVSGGSVQSLLMKFGKFSLKIVRVYMKQIVNGLAYLHLNQIIHRDIKGANILVSNTGILKLADFGASKKLADIVSFSENKTLTGTPYFMSPEVIKQSGHGKECDVWSLGCVLIEMATAKAPWSHLDPVTALFQIASEDLPLPNYPDELSNEGKEFLALCLQRNPKDRKTANELLKHPFINIK